MLRLGFPISDLQVSAIVAFPDLHPEGRIPYSKCLQNAWRVIFSKFWALESESALRRMFDLKDPLSHPISMNLCDAANGPLKRYCWSLLWVLLRYCQWTGLPAWQKQQNLLTRVSLLTVMRELLVSIISTKLTRLRLLIAGKPEGFKFCLVYCDWLGKAAYAAITLAFEIYLLSIDITSFLVDHHKIIQNPCFSSIRTHRFP